MHIVYTFLISQFTLYVRETDVRWRESINKQRGFRNTAQSVPKECSFDDSYLRSASAKVTRPPPSIARLMVRGYRCCCAFEATIYTPANHVKVYFGREIWLRLKARIEINPMLICIYKIKAAKSFEQIWILSPRTHSERVTTYVF